MAKLPAWTWLGIGLLITIISGYMEIPLFFWIGWLFVVIGIAKIIIAAVLREKPEERKAAHAVMRVPTARQPAHQYYRCSCGAPVRGSDTFCARCGRQLR